MKTIYKAIIIAVVLLAIGFFLGRWTTPPVEKIKYVKGDIVHDSIPYETLVPYKVVVPITKLLPTKPDTLWLSGKPIYIALKVDTQAIISEYVKEKYYDLTLFDNNDGKLKLGEVLQYNSIKKLTYEFTPIQKQTTIIKKRVLTPFVTASYNTNNFTGVGAGIYYHDIGASFKYVTDLREKYYEYGLYYKF